MQEQQRGRLGPEGQQGQHDQQGDDGVVYLGRSSFKMKVGANLTPPAGTPPAPRKKPTPASATQLVGSAPRPLGMTPPPVRTTPPPVLTTPPPVLAARPSVAAYRRSPVPLPVLDPSVPAPAKGKALVTGLCMIAFSCGVMMTEAVERFWPRSRGGASAASAAPATAAGGFEVTREPAIPAAQPAEVTPQPASDPEPADRAAPARSPAGKPAAEVAPQSPAPPAPALVSPVAAHVAPAVRVGPAQGRVTVRKRPTSIGAGAQPSTRETSPPSSRLPSSGPINGWADPFAQ